MLLFFIFDKLIPIIKEKTKADITDIIGGISILKNVVIWLLDSITKEFDFKNLGNKYEPAENAKKPEQRVEIYATIVVINKPFPDLFPSDAIPGTMNPIIINGIIKDKKLPNNSLNVAKSLIGKSKLRLLHIIPKVIPSTSAINIFKIKDVFFTIKPPLINVSVWSTSVYKLTT